MSRTDSEHHAAGEPPAIVSGMRPRPLPEATRLDEHGRSLALFVAVCLAYMPSFTAGFLNYDDPWLISKNPRFVRGAWDTPLLALVDLSRPIRLQFGAEYLPLRDLLVWLEAQAFGPSPAAMHAVSVLLFGLAAVLFRRYLSRTLGGPSLLSEGAAFLFALHPAHVESVAWLAGQKDVLALVFLGAALSVHAGRSRAAFWLVPLLVAAACLSKSMSVAVLVLLAATDWIKGRRPDWTRYSLTLAVISLTLGVHLYVGRVVNMLAEPLGGSTLNTLVSMGPVWLRYLALCVSPARLSIDHVVLPLTTVTPTAVLGYALIGAWLALGLWAGRRAPLVLFTFVWFFGPLAPVSQILAPLQNRMADRYLWLSVMAPALLAAGLASELSLRSRVGAHLAKLGVLALALSALGFTFERAITFSDSVLLFSDAAQKPDSGPRSTYQLAKALEAEGRNDEAIIAYRETLRRAPRGNVSDARRATNNLARLLAARGALPEAERLLREGYARFPYDAKMRKNLQKVLRSMGRDAEAEALPAARGLAPEELSF